MDSKALSKIQTLVLVAVVIVAGLAGVAAYAIFGNQDQSSETIKIGIATDLDLGVEQVWLGAVLAAEEVNKEGGVLGRQFEIVVEDDDFLATDPEVSINAVTRLISVHKADFVLAGYTNSLIVQEVCADQNVILFCGSLVDEFTQRVADDYDRYKGSFRVGIGNESSGVNGLADSLLTLKNYTGFSKIAYLYGNSDAARRLYPTVASSLSQQGFETVYENSIPGNTIDFSGYFAAIEASGAEILVPAFSTGRIPFVKEYHDRQSPFVVWGNVGSGNEKFWQETGGKCDFVSFSGLPIVASYPITSKTLPFIEAYIDRWGKEANQHAAVGYDLVRFILADAIRRAGTIETEAMIKALEATDIETTMTRRHVYTSDHDIMVGEAGPNRPGEDYLLVCLFQWQNGVPVPVYPQGIMEEAGATYKFPPWSGPWD